VADHKEKQVKYQREWDSAMAHGLCRTRIDSVGVSQRWDTIHAHKRRHICADKLHALYTINNCHAHTQTHTYTHANTHMHTHTHAHTSMRTRAMARKTCDTRKNANIGS